MDRAYMPTVSGRRRSGVGGLRDWYSGNDVLDQNLQRALSDRGAPSEVAGDLRVHNAARVVYGTAYKRGIIVGAGTVGVIWAGFVAWYMWKKKK